MRILFITLLASVALLSCKKDGATTPESASNTTPPGAVTQAPPAGSHTAFPLDTTQLKTTASGLKYQIIVQGQGERARAGDMIMANYHGTLMDGTKFDSSFERGQPFTFQLGVGQVIPGWDEAFAIFPVGTRAVIILPPSLGYGANGAPPTIPPNATLRFDVELLGASPTN
jgi:peptidylprolyl isomerase